MQNFHFIIKSRTHLINKNKYKSYCYQLFVRIFPIPPNWNSIEPQTQRPRFSLDTLVPIALTSSSSSTWTQALMWL